MNKILLTFFATFLLNISTAAAQDDEFDQLIMNGLASFEKLRKEYYIGALYLESQSQNPDTIINANGKKRLEIRIVVDKWSPRRFEKQWSDSIILGNSDTPTTLSQLASQIQDFVNIAKEDLISGDRIVIDMSPNKHTTVYLNSQRVFRTTNNDFFNVLLKTWIGSKPPSSEFKSDILTLPINDAGKELLARFEQLNFSTQRSKNVAGWFTVKEEKKSSAPSIFSPPGSSTSAKTNVTKPIVKITPAVAISKPVIPANSPSPENILMSEALARAEAETKAAQEKAAQAAAALKKIEAENKRQKALDDYLSEMYKIIAGNAKYPKRSQQRNEHGRIVVEIVLNRNGELINLIQHEPSKYDRLNDAAEKAIRQSVPFPKFAADLSGESFSFTIPINF